MADAPGRRAPNTHAQHLVASAFGAAADRSPQPGLSAYSAAELALLAITAIEEGGLQIARSTGPLTDTMRTDA